MNTIEAVDCVVAVYEGRIAELEAARPALVMKVGEYVCAGYEDYKTCGAWNSIVQNCDEIKAIRDIIYQLSRMRRKVKDAL